MGIAPHASRHRGASAGSWMPGVATPCCPRAEERLGRWSQSQPALGVLVGVGLPVPVASLMSFTNLVPAHEPSLFQSSTPWTPSSAEKYKLPSTTVRSPNSDDVLPA